MPTVFSFGPLPDAARPVDSLSPGVSCDNACWVKGLVNNQAIFLLLFLFYGTN